MRLQIALRSVAERASEFWLLLINCSKPGSAHAINRSDDEVLQIRIYNLLKVEEARSKAKERFKQQQESVKRWFDKHKAGTKYFEVGDLVLKWDHPLDEKGKHTKF